MVDKDRIITLQAGELPARFRPSTALLSPEKPMETPPGARVQMDLSRVRRIDDCANSAVPVEEASASARKPAPRLNGGQQSSDAACFPILIQRPPARLSAADSANVRARS